MWVPTTYKASNIRAICGQIGQGQTRGRGSPKAEGGSAWQGLGSVDWVRAWVLSLIFFGVFGLLIELVGWVSWSGLVGH